jgi:hypothetical protein
MSSEKRTTFREVSETNENPIRIEKLIELIKTYDFKKGSINSFSKENKICFNTVKKYVKLLNIPYNTRTIGIERKRINGRYTFENFGNLNESKINNMKINIFKPSVRTEGTSNIEDKIMQKSENINQLYEEKLKRVMKSLKK